MARVADQDETVDPRSMVRLVDDLLWRLRRGGLAISTAQAIDAVRVLDLVGVRDLATVRRALAAVVVSRARERPQFDEAFDDFLARGLAKGAPSPLERIASGLTSSELEALRDAMRTSGGAARDTTALLTLLDRGPAFDRLLWLAELSGAIDTPSDRQLGFRTYRLLGQVGFDQARAALDAVGARLTESLGDKGSALTEALADELERTREAVRGRLRVRPRPSDEAPPPGAVGSRPFAALTEGQVEEVRATVGQLAATLRGGARVRSRRARSGATVDAAATTRRAFRTGGIPVELVRTRPVRRRSRLVILCDVSESVRGAARFFLELAYLAQELFEDTRTFAFVSDLSETTRAFDRMPVVPAIEQAFDVAAAGSNSNYGRVLRRFEREALRWLDRRSSVVILGDGRTNFGDPAADVLDRVRERVKNLVWLCPEPRHRWADADSAMGLYAAKCTAVHEIVCPDDLPGAARALACMR